MAITITTAEIRRGIPGETRRIAIPTRASITQGYARMTLDIQNPGEGSHKPTKPGPRFITFGFITSGAPLNAAVDAAAWVRRFSLGMRQAIDCAHFSVFAPAARAGKEF